MCVLCTPGLLLCCCTNPFPSGSSWAYVALVPPRDFCNCEHIVFPFPARLLDLSCLESIVVTSMVFVSLADLRLVSCLGFIVVSLPRPSLGICSVSLRPYLSLLVIPGFD